MVARALQAALLGALVLASPGLAQDAPPPANPPANPPATGTPPAAPPAAPAGAPRHTSKATLGDATVVIEHGQPPWSDDRLGQMAQIPAGAVWRMGSEGISTFTLSGGPIFFGDELVQPGRYGINLVHAGDSLWHFILFEPKHEAEGVPQMMGDEPNKLIASKFTDKEAEAVPALTIDVVPEGEAGNCKLAWGPMRVTAPLTAITVTESELELNEYNAKARWYRRPVTADADATKPAIVGHIDLEIDGESCAMNVYLQLDGSNVVATMRNEERERWEREIAAGEQQMKIFDGLIQQFGAQAEAQIGPAKAGLRRRMAKNEVLLEDSTARPDNLKFTAAGEDATAGRLSCGLVKTRSGLNLEAVVGGKKALIRVDEAMFMLKSEG
jgi:hypothetical protein